MTRLGSCRLTDQGRRGQVPSLRIFEPHGLMVFTEVRQGFQDLICLLTFPEPGALDSPVLCLGLSPANGLLGQSWEGGNSIRLGPVRALPLPGDSALPSALLSTFLPLMVTIPQPPHLPFSSGWWLSDRSRRQPPASAPRDIQTALQRSQKLSLHDSLCSY